MPRTRARKQNTVTSSSEDDNVKGVKKRLAQIKQIFLDAVQNSKTLKLEKYEEKFIQERTQISRKYNNMTISELGNIQSLSSLYSSCMSNEDTRNTTRNVPKKVNKRVTRSSSCAGDDEGYLTTESTNSGSRVSRSRTKRLPTQKSTTQKTSRLSRSLSRNNNTFAQKKDQHTPSNKATPPNSYGMITPKVKPNTPLVLLRRPKIGEVALSMQGSPLMTAPIATDQIANINIPLVDGTLLSLQAQRGLRKSQVPDLDADVKRQLEMLRENLNLII